MLTLPDDHPALPGGQSQAIPFEVLKTEIMGLYRAPVVARETTRKMMYTLNQLGACGASTTADLTVTLVAEFLSRRRPDESPYTTYGYLSVIRTICTFAETSCYLRVSPFRLRGLSKWIRLPRIEEKQHMSRQEIRALLDFGQRRVDTLKGWAQFRARRDLIVWAIIAFTGLRRDECLRLYVEDIDMNACVIWLHSRGKRFKTAASEAPVPMPKALLPYVTSWLAHRMDAPFGYPIPEECPHLIPNISRRGPWAIGKHGTRAQDRFKAAAASLGITGASLSHLRKSWATHAEFFRLGPALIQRVLRHTNVSTSERFYRKADIPNLVEATKDFDF